jgi:hypothetical protein
MINFGQSFFFFFLNLIHNWLSERHKWPTQYNYICLFDLDYNSNYKQIYLRKMHDYNIITLILNHYILTIIIIKILKKFDLKLLKKFYPTILSTTNYSSQKAFSRKLYLISIRIFLPISNLKDWKKKEHKIMCEFVLFLLFMLKAKEA